MEIELGLPNFEVDGERQEFRVKSRGYVWRGKALVRQPLDISFKELQEIIEESLRDAGKGHTYVKVGRITGYKYRVVLEKDGWSYNNTSSVRIGVYSEDGGEKLIIWINPT